MTVIYIVVIFCYDVKATKKYNKGRIFQDSK